jgi:protein LSM14
MSGAQAFIGSRISLTSISDIRYRGILHGIDHAASTIQLSNVYSMGTENRRPPAEFIPPNEIPYEFIIFRATEVKDLAVDQLPPQPAVLAQRAVHEDPAVLASNQPYHRFPPGAAPGPNATPTQVAQPQTQPSPAAPNASVNPQQTSLQAAEPSKDASSTSDAQPQTRNNRNGQSGGKPRTRQQNSGSVHTASASLEKVERALGDLRVSSGNVNAPGVAEVVAVPDNTRAVMVLSRDLHLSLTRISIL